MNELCDTIITTSENVKKSIKEHVDTASTQNSKKD